jgi:hypothetical protein
VLVTSGQHHGSSQPLATGLVIAIIYDAEAVYPSHERISHAGDGGLGGGLAPQQGAAATLRRWADRTARCATARLKPQVDRSGKVGALSARVDPSKPRAEPFVSTSYLFVQSLSYRHIYCVTFLCFAFHIHSLFGLF